MAKRKGPGDYAVGYRKPPKHSQFPPGQSGNPRGKVKGSRGLKTDLAAELEAKQTIQINGRPVTARRQKLMVMTLATRAAAGDLKTAQTLLPLVVQILGIEDRGTDRGKLSALDQAILDAMLGEGEDDTSDTEDAESCADHSADSGRAPPTTHDATSRDEESEADDDDAAAD